MNANAGERFSRLVGRDYCKRYRIDESGRAVEHGGGSLVSYDTYVRRHAAYREYRQELCRYRYILGEISPDEALPSAKRYGVRNDKLIEDPLGNYARYSDLSALQKQIRMLKRNLDTILPRYREAVGKARVFLAANPQIREEIQPMLKGLLGSAHADEELRQTLRKIPKTVLGPALELPSCYEEIRAGESRYRCEIVRNDDRDALQAAISKDGSLLSIPPLGDRSTGCQYFLVANENGVQYFVPAKSLTAARLIRFAKRLTDRNKTYEICPATTVKFAVTDPQGRRYLLTNNHSEAWSMAGELTRNRNALLHKITGDRLNEHIRKNFSRLKSGFEKHGIVAGVGDVDDLTILPVEKYRQYAVCCVAGGRPTEVLTVADNKERADTLLGEYAKGKWVMPAGGGEYRLAVKKIGLYLRDARYQDYYPLEHLNYREQANLLKRLQDVTNKTAETQKIKANRLGI